MSEYQYYEFRAIDRRRGLALVTLRDDLMRGDLRCLYLGWLLDVQMGERDHDDQEPLHGLADPRCGRTMGGDVGARSTRADIEAGAGRFYSGYHQPFRHFKGRLETLQRPLARASGQVEGRPRNRGFQAWNT